MNNQRRNKLNYSYAMNLYTKVILLLAVFATGISGFGQNFTRQDTLRGSITPERVWWDLTYYDLQVAIEPATQTISGENTIHYTVLKPHNVLQFDLQTPLVIEAVSQNGKPLKYTSEGNAHYLLKYILRVFRFGKLPQSPKGFEDQIEVRYVVSIPCSVSYFLPIWFG